MMVIWGSPHLHIKKKNTVHNMVSGALHIFHESESLSSSQILKPHAITTSLQLCSSVMTFYGSIIWGNGNKSTIHTAHSHGCNECYRDHCGKYRWQKIILEKIYLRKRERVGEEDRWRRTPPLVQDSKDRKVHGSVAQKLSPLEVANYTHSNMGTPLMMMIHTVDDSIVAAEFVDYRQPAMTPFNQHCWLMNHLA